MSGATRILAAAALATSLLTGPAFAQAKQEPEKTGPQLEDDARAKRNAEIDKQYKVMQKNTKSESQTAPKTDPWQNMRSTDDKPKPNPKR